MQSEASVFILYFFANAIASKIFTRSMIYLPDETHSKFLNNNNNSVISNKLLLNNSESNSGFSNSYKQTGLINFQPVLLPDDLQESQITKTLKDEKTQDNITPVTDKVRDKSYFDNIFKNISRSATKLHIVAPTNFGTSASRNAKFINNTYYPLSKDNISYNKSNVLNIEDHSYNDTNYVRNVDLYHYENITNSTVKKSSYLENLYENYFEFIKREFPSCSIDKVNITCALNFVYYYGNEIVIKVLENSNFNYKSVLDFIDLFANMYKCIWETGATNCNEDINRKSNDVSELNHHIETVPRNIQYVSQNEEVINNAKGYLKGKHKWIQYLLFILFKLKIILLPIVTGLAFLSGKALSVSFLALILSLVAGSTHRLSEVWHNNEIKRDDIYPQISNYKSSGDYYM